MTICLEVIFYVLFIKHWNELFTWIHKNQEEITYLYLYIYYFELTGKREVMGKRIGWLPEQNAYTRLSVKSCEQSFRSKNIIFCNKYTHLPARLARVMVNIFRSYIWKIAPISVWSKYANSSILVSVLYRTKYVVVWSN